MKKPQTVKRNSVRIIAGDFRSRKLGFPDVPGLRPTADRIRETLFNWVREQIPGETCLDMFAGSGAIGFEALSRGAARVVFIEKDQRASRSIAENIQLLEVANAKIVCDNALHWLVQQDNQKAQFGLVFIDPPFSEKLVYSACEHLQSSGLLKTGGKIYIETEDALIESAMPSDWKRLKSKKAGSVLYYLYENLRENIDENA